MCAHPYINQCIFICIHTKHFRLLKHAALGIRSAPGGEMNILFMHINDFKMSTFACANQVGYGICWVSAASVSPGGASACWAIVHKE